MDPREINHLSIEEKKARFRQVTITHRLLEQTHRKIMQAVREPAGLTFVLMYGPTGVGKSKQPVEKVLSKLISKERHRVSSVLRKLNQAAPATTPSPK